MELPSNYKASIKVKMLKHPTGISVLRILFVCGDSVVKEISGCDRDDG